jgi:hypothetical protein
MTPTPRTCKTCPAELPAQATGRPRIYCTACRPTSAGWMRAHRGRQHAQAEHDQATELERLHLPPPTTEEPTLTTPPTPTPRPTTPAAPRVQTVRDSRYTRPYGDRTGAEASREHYAAKRAERQARWAAEAEATKVAG